MRGSGCQETGGHAVAVRKPEGMQFPFSSPPQARAAVRGSLFALKRPCFVPSAAAGLWLSRFCRAVSPLGCAARAGG